MLQPRLASAFGNRRGTWAIGSIQIDSLQADHCGNSDTCSYTYWVSFKDDGDYLDHYYWAAFEGLSNNSDEAIGKPLFLYNNGDRMQVSVTGHYFDLDSVPNYYALWVYRCDSEGDAGNACKANSVGQLVDLNAWIGQFGSDCGTCCCTDSTTSRNRWYVSAVKQVNDVIAVQGEITTTFGEHLCGYSIGSTEPAFSNVHINISNASEGIWAQVGLTHERLDHTTNTEKWIYFEISNGTPFPTQLFYYPDAVGSLHHYHCAVEPASGEIVFGYDYQPVDALTELVWSGKTGTSVSWTGELYTRESDMAGTNSSRCVISDCQYKVDGGSFQPANITAYGNDDPQEWEIIVDQNGTRVTIWDWNPLP